MQPADDFWKKFSTAHSDRLHQFDRSAEIIFGLIMVLTFTCSISAATAGREEIRTILWAAIGCNIAWGLVDALMFLLEALMERSTTLQLLKKVQDCPRPQDGQSAIKEAMSPLLATLITKDAIEQLQNNIQQLPPAPERAYFTTQDLKNAALVFTLVFLSTFPVVIPFMFIKDGLLALRVSNGVALLLLFGFGLRFGKNAGFNVWLSGFAFACLGAILVWITIMLGG